MNTTFMERTADQSALLTSQTFFKEEDLQKRFESDVRECTRLAPEDFKFLRSGNVVYWRRAKDQKLFYGKLICVVFKEDKPEKLVFPGYKNAPKSMEVNLYDVSEVFKRQDGESVLEVERLRKEVAEVKAEHAKTKAKLQQVITKVQELSEFCAKFTAPRRDSATPDRQQ